MIPAKCVLMTTDGRCTMDDKYPDHRLVCIHCPFYKSSKDYSAKKMILEMFWYLKKKAGSKKTRQARYMSIKKQFEISKEIWGDDWTLMFGENSWEEFRKKYLTIP